MLDALRNLDVWKRSCRLSVNVYKLLERCPNRSFRDQVARSALSIASNIAEGYERESPKDRMRCLTIAKGSCGECWTQLLIGAEAVLVDKSSSRGLVAELEEISRMLRGLIVRYGQDGSEP